ncbi:MAG: SusF/SusE family outer membrane protein, partial [Bacteroidales bacterium]
VVMTASNWKFRYSGGWKVFIDPDFDLGGGTIGIKVNSNFGGSLTNLVPGGADMSNDVVGEYTAKLVWKLGEPYTATLIKTGDVELPEYPEAMYLVGAASYYDWHTPGEKDDALFHKIAGGGGNEGIFWKIAHLEGGQGFKFSAENWSDPNLGFADVNEYDAEGVTVSADGGDMMVDESKMYMIVLDLRNDMVKVSIKEAAVHGIGPAFGGWDEPTVPFINNHAEKTIVSPPLPTTGTIRMFADHSWIPDWWNAEFVVENDVIFYRNDSNDDPPVVEGTAGQVITLHFDDNTGSID